MYTRSSKAFQLFMVILVLASVLAIAPKRAGAQSQVHDVRPGPGVTRTARLSDYFVSLRGTAVDTCVYHMESGVPGPTLFILGGTHSNEIAGIMAATLIVERAAITAGRVIVVPYANASGASYSDTVHPEIGYYSITTRSGVRTFRYGDRRTSVEHQGPDPEVYVHFPSGQKLAADEARNLNRSYPGRPDGNLTQQLAYAYQQLLIKEKVHIAFDLHEAGPTSRLANMIVANPKNLDCAVIAIVDLEMQGIVMNVEHSSADFRGLSHKEWGDTTQAAAYLVETPNPAQLSEAVDPDVVNDPVNPLAKRAATHLASIEAVLNAHEFLEGQRPCWTGLPSYQDLVANGLGAYLR